MSEAKAKISFYKISKCGYYKKNGREHAFCSNKELLDELKKWTYGRQLGLTITFEPKEDSQNNKIYCYELFIGESEGAVLTTWNGYKPDDDSSIAAINSHAKVGEIDENDMLEADLKSGYIPGYATYFWFTGKDDIYATVIFSGTKNGRRDMEAYLKAFLTFHNKGHIFKDNQDKLFYGETKKDKGKYKALFTSNRIKLQGAINEIKNKVDKINQVVNRIELDINYKSHESIWQTFVKLVGLGSNPIVHNRVAVETSMNCSPKAKELDEMIDSWSSNPSEVGKLGVMIKGDERIFWFDSCFASTEIDIEIETNKYGIVDARSLFTALNKNKDNIIGKAYPK